MPLSRRSAGAVDPAALIDAVKAHMPDGELESLARQDGALVLSYVFQRVAQDRLGPLETTLRTAAPGSTFSVFFTRPGAQ